MSRRDRVEPPGLGAVLLRTAAFCALVSFRFFDGTWLADDGPLGQTARFLFGVSAVVGLLLLLLPMRGSKDYRGFHERVSNTGVVRVARARRSVRLPMPAASRLAGLAPMPAGSAFDIRPYLPRRGEAGPGAGEWVIVGEDGVLGRELLFHLQPAAAVGSESRGGLQRTTRLRLHGTGATARDGVAYRWSAYTLPDGAPLADVAAARVLRWPEVRPILEELVEELRDARADGTLPHPLGLDQVWVREDGRLQLLDFPVGANGAAVPPAASPLHLVRQVLVQALEGNRPAEGQGQTIAAPIPEHARRLIGAALEDSREEALDRLHEGLAASRLRPARVDSRHRLYQIGLMGAFLAGGLSVMFSMAGLFTVFLVLIREAVAVQGETVLAAMDDPRAHAAWNGDEAVRAILAEPDFRRGLATLVETSRREAAQYRLGLTFIEREISAGLDPKRRPATADDRALIEYTRAVSVLIDRGRLGEEGEAEGRRAMLHEDFWEAFAQGVLAWPLLWAVLSFLFRGGPSLGFSRMRLVDARGRPARRLLCAVRALAVWLPVAGLLVACVWFQAFLPAWVASHAVLWWLALGLVAAYAIHALKFPEQSWLDRQLGLILIPD